MPGPTCPPGGALGEMVLSVGKAAYLAKHGADGIIDISPFTCMNGIVSEAIYPKLSKAYGGIPIRNFYFDGTQADLDRDLGIYMELARSYREKKPYQRRYPAYFAQEQGHNVGASAAGHLMGRSHDGNTNPTSFERRIFGRTGMKVGRLGISSSYGVPGDALERAFEQGVNYIYWGSRRLASFGEGLKRLRPQRDRFVLVIQSYTRVAGLMAWSLERALRALDYDHTDVLLLGMWNKPVTPKILDAARATEAARPGAVPGGLHASAHTVPQIAAASDFDVVHFRYNAAHPGAEQDIFPSCPPRTVPAWLRLPPPVGDNSSARQSSCQAVYWCAPIRFPKTSAVPTATDCYRYVLSRPEVDVCMTGPSMKARMNEALEALRRGPMTDEELAWMQRVGRAITGK